MRKRYHYREKRSPAWWIRDCSENQSPSTAAQAGRIGVLSSEAMRVHVLRRWAYSWNERREISWTAAQRDFDAVGGIVLDTAVLHAGDAVQRDCSDTSGECWCTGSSCITNRPR